MEIGLQDESYRHHPEESVFKKLIAVMLRKEKREWKT
jgi:hypothetical protein